MAPNLDASRARSRSEGWPATAGVGENRSPVTGEGSDGLSPPPRQAAMPAPNAAETPRATNSFFTAEIIAPRRWRDRGELFFMEALQESLTTRPVPDAPGVSCNALIAAVNATLATSKLPAANAVPTYTDVQRIFNRSCIECHGGLRIPPRSNIFPVDDYLDLSEEEAPPAGRRRMERSHMVASGLADGGLNSQLLDRLLRTSEDCPNGMMPCGGPALSQVDIQTIRRWIDGGRS